jgi:3-hydroxyisobutyrate dehydrogenase
MTEAGETASGMIGLGNMGGRIARRIRAAGLPVQGYDRDAAQAANAGVPSRTSIAELVADAHVVFLSLPDSTVVEQVVFGDGGLLGCVRAGQVVVDLSTAAPSSSVKIHAALGEQDVAFVDAGISGGAAGAEQGTLAIMAGGSAEALAIAAPILATFSAHVYHMGEPGSGHVAKLLNNFLNAISLAATAEVMVAAKQADLDLAQFLDVVNHSSGINFATLNRFPRIIEGDYLEGGLTGALMAKDVRLYLEYLQELGVTSFTGTACLGAFNLAGALGYGDQISNRVVDAIGDIAGGVRVQQTARGTS